MDLPKTLDSTASTDVATPGVLDGDGDGVRHAAASSRKFGARAAAAATRRGGGDDAARLGRALEGMLEGTKKGGERRKGERDCCAAVRRARTVAEITPTKGRVGRRTANKPPTPGTERSVAALHATPRPFVADAPPPSRAAAPRPCRRPDALCRVYERLMLAAWRRQRRRLQEGVETCEKYRNQIGQLEVQVDFLKAMRISECQKRDEAISECQLLRKKNEVFEEENSHLIKEVKSTQEELTNVKKNLKLFKCDLKRSSEQAAKLQDQLKKKKEEKLDLLSKLSAHEQEIACQTSFIIGLKEKLKIAEMNLHNSEVNLNDKQDTLDEMIRHLRAEVESNERLKAEITELKSTEADLVDHSRHLADRLEACASRLDDLEEENASVRRELFDTSLELVEEKKRWYSRELVVGSLEALGKVARAFLPLRYREY